MSSNLKNNSRIPVFLMRHGHSCANFYLLKHKYIKFVSRFRHKNTTNPTISKMYQWINGNNNRDSYLNELGILQAIVAGYLFKETLPTIFYTSAMFRAIETSYFFLFGYFLKNMKLSMTVNVTPYLKEDGPATSDMLRTEDEIKKFCTKLPRMLVEILKILISFMTKYHFSSIFDEIFQKINSYTTNNRTISKPKIIFEYSIIPNSNNNYSDPNNNYDSFIELLNNRLKNGTELQISNNSNNPSNNTNSNLNNRSNNRISNSNNPSIDKIMIVSHNHTISNKFCNSGIFDRSLENTSISKMFYNKNMRRFNNTRNSNGNKFGKCRIIYSPQRELLPKEVFGTINNTYIQVETICNKMEEFQKLNNTVRNR